MSTIQEFPLSKGIYVCGARKCGTTTIYDSLTKLSAVYEGKFKEPQFFALSENLIKDHLGWYLDLFKVERGNGCIIDGSTLYSLSSHSLEAAASITAEPKFILAIRDPAKRLYSAYWHMHAKPGRPENRSFSRIISELKSAQQEKKNLQQAEYANIETAIKENLIDAAYFGEKYHRLNYGAPFPTKVFDPLIFYRYYYESCYSQSYKRLEKYPHQVVVFEELVRNPGAELKRILKNLEIGVEEIGLAPNNNKTRDAGSWRFLKQIPGLDRVLRLASPDLKRKLKAALFPPPPKLEEGDYWALRELLQSEYNFWAEILPQTKDLWKY